MEPCKSFKGIHEGTCNEASDSIYTVWVHAYRRTNLRGIPMENESKPSIKYSNNKGISFILRIVRYLLGKMM